MERRSAVPAAAGAATASGVNSFAPVNHPSSADTDHNQHLVTRCEERPRSSSQASNVNTSLTATTSRYFSASPSTTSHPPPFSPLDTHIAQRGIYDFTTAELRAEIKLLETREDQIWEAMERQEAIIEALGGQEGKEKREAVWKHGQLRAALDLQSDRRTEVIRMLRDKGEVVEKTEGT